jgi:hypothetical protein
MEFLSLIDKQALLHNGVGRFIFYTMDKKTPFLKSYSNINVKLVKKSEKIFPNLGIFVYLCTIIINFVCK